MIEINPHIFRAYDIRGKAIHEDPSKIDLTPESVYVISRAIATYMRQKLNKRHDEMLHIVVGRDCRLTGGVLLDAMIKGLRHANCKVANIDLATSPLVYYAVCKYGYEAGLVLTASHNHKNDNGIKIVEHDAHSVCGDELQSILKIAQEQNFEDFSEFTGDDGEAGAYYLKEDTFDDYVEDLVKKLPLDGDVKPIKVVVDSGNGVAGKFIGPLLKAAGCEVIELYSELDGNYPNHEANPEYAENLVDLSKTVVEYGYDIGFGFDGDGDRVGVIDEKGAHYSADQIVILLARDILQRQSGAPIVFDVKCSRLVEEEIKKAGGVPVVERTGHSFIENRMKKEGAPLAGEVSGHIFIAEDYYGFDDALFAALKIIKILHDQRTTKGGVNTDDVQFSELLADLPTTFTTPEIKVPCPDNVKFDIVDKVKQHYQQTHRCLTIDGAKIHFSDSTWGLVRCSNTSPYLTLRFEAETEEELKNAQQTIAKHLSNYPDLDTAWMQKIHS